MNYQWKHYICASCGKKVATMSDEYGYFKDGIKCTYCNHSHSFRYVQIQDEEIKKEKENKEWEHRVDKLFSNISKLSKFDLYSIFRKV